MIRFSANLGFLWTDLPLPEAIERAAAAGFDAVECHGPYAFDSTAVRAALRTTGLVMESLNTRMGGDGEFGVAAVPGREAEARSHIDEAVGYASAIGCRAVSVFAGRTGRTAAAESAYRANLEYACAVAAPQDVTVVIEPLNDGVGPDYHLLHAAHGIETIEAVGASNLGLLLDCFHTRMMDGPLLSVFERSIEYVERVQFAAWPDRSEPDGGEIDYHELLPAIRALGYDGSFGAEYNPKASVEDGLGWLEEWTEERRNR